MVALLQTATGAAVVRGSATTGSYIAGIARCSRMGITI